MSDRREREREYENDVMYEVYRRGGNVDRVNYDRVDSCFDADVSVDSAARSEIERQRPALEEEEELP